jgi:riboflavin kinase/FMN adenylyltransferase
VEAHIFNFNREIYGKQVKIYFEKKLRDDMKFESKLSLINQIKKDIENLKVDKGPFF